MPKSKFTLVPIPLGEDGEPVPAMPACEVCHGAAELCLLHLRDGNTEWVCYSCHITQMAGVLTDMALAEAAAE